MTDFERDRLWRAFDVSWNQSDFTISAFGGQLRLAPEMMEDIKARYNLSEANIFSWVSHVLNKNNFDRKVDLKIEMLPSFFAKKESMFSIAVFDLANKENVLARCYFSSSPVTNNEESETSK
jgi:hypothetical protein